jgi:hypothetical protein
MLRPGLFSLLLCATRALPATNNGVASADIGGISFCDFRNAFGAGPPPYYVTYKTEQPPVIDGSLDDAAWAEVPFTDSNPDICGYDPTTAAGRAAGGFCAINSTNGGGARSCAKGCAAPRFRTRQKIRWDDSFLYVGALLEETAVWANNTAHDSVIFSDNDYEVFISPDGSNHYYKEYEMNARGTWWDLCLNKPYTDGGYENSTRVFNHSAGGTKPGAGWDDPGLRTAARVRGCALNEPPAPGAPACRGWSLEIAFPLAAISLNNTNELPPRRGSYWRINFSRVEWNTTVVGGGGGGGGGGGDGGGVDGAGSGGPRHYVKRPANETCDNWLWAPLGIVDVHQPERWGYLQFADGPVNATVARRDPDWAVRSVAMQLYVRSLARD